MGYDYRLDLTKDQEELVRMRDEGGMPWNAIAKQTGKDKANLQRSYKAAKKKLAARGIAPEHNMTKTAAEGFNVNRVSTLYNSEGQISAQWVITDREREQTESVIEVVREALQGFRSPARRVKAPKAVSTRRITVLPMGDPHLGMLSWAPETGEDFNLKIATEQLIEATARLVHTCPPCSECIVLNLGDFFHSHDDTARTKQSGHSLDLDGRWPKVYQAGVQTMIACVDIARRHHKKVIVKNLIGNHDDHISFTLSVALDAYFHRDPRVHVDLSPAMIWYHQFHKNLIAATHGHTIKPAEIGGVIAHDQPQMWADTTHRYAFFGHVHHSSKGTANESPGVKWESFRTLAAKDAWHASQRYRSGRDMHGIVLDRDHGETERHRVDVSMLESYGEG